jgi:hypothetical protein
VSPWLNLRSRQVVVRKPLQPGSVGVERVGGVLHIEGVEEVDDQVTVSHVTSISDSPVALFTSNWHHVFTG